MNSNCALFVSVGVELNFHQGWPLSFKLDLILGLGNEKHTSTVVKDKVVTAKV